MSLILKWILNAAAVLLVSYLVPGVVVQSVYTALIVALVVGIINVTIKPIIIFFTLPLNFLTLGLFTLVINGLLFWLAATIVKGFSVTGFWPAFLGALLFSLASTLLNRVLK